MRSASMVWCPYFIKLSIFCATLLLYVFFLQFVLPRADVLITQPIEEVWRNRNFESLDKVKWTNVGLRSGVFRTYPGHRSTRGYDPTEYVTTRNYLCHTYHKCITILSIAVSLTFIAVLINVPLTVVNYLLLLFLKYLTLWFVCLMSCQKLLNILFLIAVAIMAAVTHHKEVFLQAPLV